MGVTIGGVNANAGPGENLARRRYQKGRLFLRGKLEPKWIGRWRRDDIQPDGRRIRREVSVVLGTKKDIATRKLALRELEKRLEEVNHPLYRGRPVATFGKFAEQWQRTVATQHKPSTQINLKCHIGKRLKPYFGECELRDISPEAVQRFVSDAPGAPKTKRNILATLRMMWKSARAWGYVSHDVFDGIVLPDSAGVTRNPFTLEEARKILDAAPEPYRTFYWLAMETGMRAGELCGLCVEDIDFGRGILSVQRSAWRGKLQSPKTKNAVRVFALSAKLVEHLRSQASGRAGLLFATRNGTPWDPNMLIKRRLYPLLDGLKIERRGLHSFRHANSTLMDRIGVPVKLRSQRLGHSDPRITLGVYTHIASEDDVRVAQQLGDILRPNAPNPKETGAAENQQPQS